MFVVVLAVVVPLVIHLLMAEVIMVMQVQKFNHGSSRCGKQDTTVASARHGVSGNYGLVVETS